MARIEGGHTGRTGTSQMVAYVTDADSAYALRQRRVRRGVVSGSFGIAATRIRMSGTIEYRGTAATGHQRLHGPHLLLSVKL